jgi:hypothetical protein
MYSKTAIYNGRCCLRYIILFIGNSDTFKTRPIFILILKNNKSSCKSSTPFILKNTAKNNIIKLFPWYQDR